MATLHTGTGAAAEPPTDDRPTAAAPTLPLLQVEGGQQRLVIASRQAVKESVTVASEAEPRCVVDALFSLEVEDDSLSLTEHEEDAALEASGAEVHSLPIVVANDRADFGGWIVDLDDTLHGREV